MTGGMWLMLMVVAFLACNAIDKPGLKGGVYMTSVREETHHVSIAFFYDLFMTGPKE